MSNENGKENVFGGYLAEFHRTPELKTWEPTEFDLSYYAGRRLETERAKRNAAYAKEYERAMSAHNSFMAAYAKVTGVHRDLARFFEETLSSWVESHRTRIATLRRAMASLKEKHSHEVSFSYTSYEGKAASSTIVPFNQRSDFRRMFWKGEKRDFHGKIVEHGHVEMTGVNSYYEAAFNAFAPTVEAKMAFFDDMARYDEAQNELNITKSPCIVFHESVEHFASIVKAIEDTLGGSPDFVEYGSHWGVGGHFNCIVGRNGKRASFKSFLAGGWNIQRLHIRYRITVLKD